MTRKDVVEQIARAYAEGVSSAMKGELISLNVAGWNWRVSNEK